MTAPPRGTPSLRARLLTAFAAVAVAAIALVTSAALIGTSQGLSAQVEADRRATAQRAASAAADAYHQAGGWDGADLGQVLAIAAGADAYLRLVDPGGNVVTATTGQGMGAGMGNGSGMGNGPGRGAGAGRTTSPTLTTVTVDGATVGTLALLFPTSSTTTARPVAWRWVGLAGATALALAVLAAWLITRMLTRPLAALTATARAFAGGDRAARTGIEAPGELGELAAAFDQAATQVQLAEQARRQMSADVAHELRTPLAALQAGLEELRDGLVPADAAALARLHDQSLRLGRVVTDLAELARADAAPLTLQREPLDLAAVVAEAADDQDASLRAAGLTLVRQLQDGVRVAGDAGRLQQVTGNLLRNCVRHCRPGDVVTLTVRHAPPGETVPDSARPAGAVLIVADTGPGIAAQDLPHVFTRFWRAGDGGGSGLGMAIVRSIVEAHGGRARVESDGRSGTVVTVVLPPDGPVVRGRGGPTG